MKGLLRNNFYSVEGNLKMAIAVSLFLMLCGVVGSKVYWSNALLSFLLLAQMMIFVAFPSAALQRDTTSKWNKFELTLPVQRKDVIQARCISFVLYGLIGVAISGATVLLVYVTGGQLNPERITSSFTTGVLALFASPALMYPLTLRFGIEKSETIWVISLLLIMVAYVFFAGALSPFFGSLKHGDLLFRGASIAISLGSFLVSYFVSVAIYKKKEL